MTTFTLHAHVSTSSRDCDGGHGENYLTFANDDEIAEMVAADGINDFSEIHFMNRVLTNHCSPYAVDPGLRITITDDGFEWNGPTDEGYRSGEVTWCREEGCDDRHVVFDEYAQAMGY